MQIIRCVASHPHPAVRKLSKRTPHEHHWVSENTAGQVEFERWVCAWCGQKRIQLTADRTPQLVRDWLEHPPMRAGRGHTPPAAMEFS